MSDENGKSKFDWRVIIISGLMVVAQSSIQWGVTSATLAEHTRRLELIEKRMDERSVARDEYERRHEDLKQSVRDLKVLVEENRKAIDAIRTRR